MKHGIFLTKEEIKTLLEGLNLLIDKEQDTINHTRIHKVLTEYYKMSEESTLFEDFLEYCNEDNEQLKKDIETWLCDFFDIPNRETPLDQYEQDFIRANLTPKNQRRILGATIEDTKREK